RADCSTDMPRLFAAGEDTGGVHGANRLGGNGVANSTVFGGVAGDTMASFVSKERGALPEPDRAALATAMDRASAGLGGKRGDLEGARRTLLSTMWEDAGILRTGQSLSRAQATLQALARDVAAMGVGSADPAFNLTFMDRLNLENLVLVSRAIVASALAREDSRGAHFREDIPETSELSTSRYTVARWSDEAIATSMAPVRFTRVRPGETLLSEAAE
ncbi:MAG: FAD-binding protein, partial [Hyphomicrobiales bacterium]|nr:FAD-binding protein [Hyphomicrobiales bacterium]